MLLLTLLPLQFGWAAVAPYCAHEASPAAEHVGHHSHQHAGSPADTSKAEAGKLAAAPQAGEATHGPAGWAYTAWAAAP
ncbi:MAG: hypothetical protein LCH73_05000 [Proteobacteria bacterium]|nr:hypothetical protein [Pseudomonadota bacterium]